MGAFMIWDAYMPGVTSIKGYRYPALPYHSSLARRI